MREREREEESGKERERESPQNIMASVNEEAVTNALKLIIVSYRHLALGTGAQFNIFLFRVLTRSAKFFPQIALTRVEEIIQKITLCIVFSQKENDRGWKGTGFIIRLQRLALEVNLGARTPIFPSYYWNGPGVHVCGWQRCLPLRKR